MKLVSIVFYPEPPPIFYKDIERLILDRRTEEQIFHACQSVSNPTSSKRKVSIATQLRRDVPQVRPNTQTPYPPIIQTFIELSHSTNPPQ